MLLMSSLVLLQQYFNRRRALAVSVASIGFSFGGMTFGPLTAELLQVYAVRGTLLIIAAIFFQMSVFCCLFRPAPGHCRGLTAGKIKSVVTDGKEEMVLTVGKVDLSKELQENNKLVVAQSPTDAESSSQHPVSRALKLLAWIRQLFADLFDFSLLKCFAFRLFVIGTFCVFFGYSSFVQHIPSRADHFGIEPQSISLLPVFICFTTMISRLISGFIAHSPCTSLVLQFAISVTLSGILQITMWLATSFTTIALYCILIGLING